MLEIYYASRKLIDFRTHDGLHEDAWEDQFDDEIDRENEEHHYYIKSVSVQNVVAVFALVLLVCVVACIAQGIAYIRAHSNNVQ